MYVTIYHFCFIHLHKVPFILTFCLNIAKRKLLQLVLSALLYILLADIISYGIFILETTSWVRKGFWSRYHSTSCKFYRGSMKNGHEKKTGLASNRICPDIQRASVHLFCGSQKRDIRFGSAVAGFYGRFLFNIRVIVVTDEKFCWSELIVLVLHKVLFSSEGIFSLKG